MDYIILFMVCVLFGMLYDLRKKFKEKHEEPSLEDEVFVYRALVESYKMVATDQDAKAAFVYFEDQLNTKSYQDRETMIAIAREATK